MIKNVAGQPPPERLSIAHLLLWTSTSAVLLGVQRAMTSVGNPGGVLSDVITFFYAPIFGAGLAACLLAGWRISRGGPQFPREPGHWLLVVGGLNAIVSLSFQLLMTLAMFQASVMQTLLAIRLVSGIAIAVFFALATRDARGVWRRVMFFAFSASLLSLLFDAGQFLSPWAWKWSYLAQTALYWLVTLAILVAAGTDLARQERRDALHWAGVATRIAYALVVLAIPFLMRWLGPMSG